MFQWVFEQFSISHFNLCSSWFSFISLFSFFHPFQCCVISPLFETGLVFLSFKQNKFFHYRPMMICCDQIWKLKNSIFEYYHFQTLDIFTVCFQLLYLPYHFSFLWLWWIFPWNIRKKIIKWIKTEKYRRRYEGKYL